LVALRPARRCSTTIGPAIRFPIPLLSHPLPCLPPQTPWMLPKAAPRKPQGSGLVRSTPDPSGWGGGEWFNPVPPPELPPPHLRMRGGGSPTPPLIPPPHPRRPGPSSPRLCGPRGGGARGRGAPHAQALPLPRGRRNPNRPAEGGGEIKNCGFEPRGSNPWPSSVMKPLGPKARF